MKKLNQQGIGHLLLIVIIGVAVLGVVGFAGWRVYQGRQIDASANSYSTINITTIMNRNNDTFRIHACKRTMRDTRGTESMNLTYYYETKITGPVRISSEVYLRDPGKTVSNTRRTIDFGGQNHRTKAFTTPWFNVTDNRYHDNHELIEIRHKTISTQNDNLASVSAKEIRNCLASGAQK